MADSPTRSLGSSFQAHLIKIGGIAFCFALGFYLYTKWIPPVWLARAEIAVPSSGSKLGDVGALLNLGQESPLQYLRGLFESRAMRQHLSEVSPKHGFTANVPKIDTIFSGKAFVDTSQLVLEARHENKTYAIALLKEALRFGRVLDEQTAGSIAVKKAGYHEGAIRSAMEDMDTASKAAVDFQKRANTAPDPLNPFGSSAYKQRLLDIEGELRGIETQIGTFKSEGKKNANLARDVPTEVGNVWREKLRSLEYDLHVREITYGQSSPAVVAIKKEIAIAEREFKNETNAYLKGLDANSSPGLSDLIVKRETLKEQRDYMRKMADQAPGESATLQKLTRDAAAKGEVVSALQKQQEIAFAEAYVNRINWAVLGEPYIHDEPINKRAAINGVIGGLFGVALATMLFFFLDGRRR